MLYAEVLEYSNIRIVEIFNFWHELVALPHTTPPIATLCCLFG